MASIIAGAAIGGTEMLTEGMAGGIVPIISNAMTFLGVSDVLNEVAKGAGWVVKKIDHAIDGKKEPEHKVRIDPTRKDGVGTALENIFSDLKIKDMGM